MAYFYDAQNSSRDSQATGSSNLREFRGNQIAKTTCEQLSSSFSYASSYHENAASTRRVFIFKLNFKLTLKNSLNMKTAFYYIA